MLNYPDMMKKSLRNLILALGLGAALASTAAVAPTTVLHGLANGMTVEPFEMKLEGGNLYIDLGLDIEHMKVSGNRAKVVMPRLINGNDSLTLDPLGLYGHRRYYYYQRNSPDGTMIAGRREMVYKRSQAPDTLSYHIMVPYQEWMNGASMVLCTEEFGCCHSMEAMQLDTLAVFHHYTFNPQWLFVRPKAEDVKVRALSGRAFIDFPVDQTIIYPDYRRNTTELDKIQRTIDTVRNDRDVTITRVWLKGFASPESPYSHNTDLSLGRVAALKDHIQNLYHFEPGVIETDNEPEDWEGLRRFVEASNLEHRQEIIDLIDSDMKPDPKEALIKKRYPAEYKFMLTQYYPALRHTDYRIDYFVRNYTDLDEIRRVFRYTPSKLSLNELFILANSYPEGSAEFNDVISTAVRMYPTDPIANHNAATSAMEKGDYQLAAQYLKNAGDSPQAVYCRGVLAALEKDYDLARALLHKAADQGVPQATDALEQIDRMLE